MRWKVSHLAREKNAVLRVVMVAVMVMPVMAPVVARRLRLRSHRSEQEQEQGSEKKLFHTLRVPPENDLCDNPPKSKFRSGHSQ